MFPWIYEFKWTPTHIIFLMLFFSVAMVIATTLFRALVRSWRDFLNHRDQEVLWESAFEEIPDSSKQCRHALAGEVTARICQHGFDCRECEKHPEFLALEAEQNTVPTLVHGETEYIQGFSVPLDRYYHRGHTWARPEEDGSITIGLDDFAQRVVGIPDAVELPQRGTMLRVNGTAWMAKKRKTNVRILSPVEGEVVETGNEDGKPFLRIKPVAKENAFTHLLRGSELRAWYLKELERLQVALRSEAVGVSLADGGTPVDDMPREYPEADWDAVWGEVFLEP